MKRTILSILTISMLVVFNGCDKDYDYRDKWEGDYEYEFFHKSHLHGTGTLSVNKYAQDSVIIAISTLTSYSTHETYIFYYHFQVKNNGSIELHQLDFGDCWSGCFKNRNNLELTFYNLYNETDNTYTYQCKKIKK